MAPSRDNKPSRRAWLANSTMVLMVVLSRILYFSAERRRSSGFLISLLGNELITAAITPTKMMIAAAGLIKTATLAPLQSSQPPQISILK